jgi:hypothetical protein
VKVKAKASNLVGTAVPSLALTSTSSSLKTGDAAGVFQQQDSLSSNHELLLLLPTAYQNQNQVATTDCNNTFHKSTSKR